MLTARRLSALASTCPVHTASDHWCMSDLQPGWWLKGYDIALHVLSLWSHFELFSALVFDDLWTWVIAIAIKLRPGCGALLPPSPYLLLDWLNVSACFLHCVSKKRRPFYFHENLAKYYPISIIFGSSIPEEICNKSLHVYPPYLFTVLMLYLVLWSTYLIHLPVFTCFKKWHFYCVQQVSQMPSEFHNFSRHMPEEFCNETFMSVSPPNLALHVAAVPCNASKNMTACQHKVLAKL